MMKKLTLLVVAVSILFGSSQAAFARFKSPALIDGNMDYRRSLVMQSDFKTYVKTSPENYVYYGAKFEPRAGIYIGTPYNCKYPDIDNAINTEYDWFVPSEDIKNDKWARNEIAEVPSDHTVLKGYNWNFSLKNDQVIDIREYSNYLYNKIDEIASWGEDVLLIFGKEMNIDDNFNDPALFRECFRFVASYAKTKENIAMVWAPNDTGGLDTTLEEYYPGDEYVDWIGCSMYTMPYFQGKPENNDAAQMSFIMGPYANPSMRAKLIHDFMVKNNIKKPVFITEGGVGYQSPSGVDYTDWAKKQLRMYYADICRAYPEFKCIVSFNQFVYPGDLYRYDIAKSPELLEIMQEVTSDPIYLKEYPSSAPYSFMELFDGMVFTGTIEVSSYAYIPRKQDLVVRYLIDGKWIGERSEPPYEIRLTNNDVSYGWHTMTCEIWDGEKISHTKNYSIALTPVEDNYAYADVTDDGTCQFEDMAGKPAEMRNAAAFLADRGVVSGIDGVNFAPDRKISRAEMSTILMKMMGLNESTTPTGFTDLSENDWYYGIVNAAVQAGLISGYEDNTFRGGNAITRNEFITIMSQIVKKEEGTGVPDIELGYDDVIADWVVDYVKISKDKELILERNDNIFSGTTEVKRGDAVIMAKRLYDEVVEHD